MSNCPDILYLNTDVNIRMSIGTSKLTNQLYFTDADVTELTVILTDISGAGGPSVYTIGNGAVTFISTATYNLKIARGTVMAAGFYRVSMTMTHTNGDVLGITPCLSGNYKTTLQFV